MAIWVGTEEQDATEEARSKRQHQGKHHYQQQVQCHTSAVGPVKCTANVYQGKIEAGFDSSGLSDPKLVVLLENREMATAVRLTFIPGNRASILGILVYTN